MDTKQTALRVILSVIVIIILIYALLNLIIYPPPAGSGASYDSNLPLPAQEGIANNLFVGAYAVRYLAQVFAVFTLLFGILVVWKILKPTNK